MSSKMETFDCLIYYTKYMMNLWDENLEEYLECRELTQNWDKFEKVEDFVNLNNKHINNAIKEMLASEEFMKELEESEIYINKEFMKEKGLM